MKQGHDGACDSQAEWPEETGNDDNASSITAAVAAHTTEMPQMTEATAIAVVAQVRSSVDQAGEGSGVILADRTFAAPGSCPSAQPLRPQTQERIVSSELMLPPSDSSCTLFPIAADSHQETSSRAPIQPGPSVQMWWAIYLAWSQRTGLPAGMPTTLSIFVATYMPRCIFQASFVGFLVQLQAVLALISWCTASPSWLWWIRHERQL